MGTGIGSMGVLTDEHMVLLQKGPNRVSPFFIPSMLPNMAAAQISRIFGARGYNSTTVTACAAGTQAIGEGLEVIRRGDADVMLVGGSDASICALGLAGFCACRALSTRNDDPACEPAFDAKRRVVPAKAPPYWLSSRWSRRWQEDVTSTRACGFGVTSDAYHGSTRPEEEGGPSDSGRSEERRRKPKGGLYQRSRHVDR